MRVRFMSVGVGGYLKGVLKTWPLFRQAACLRWSCSAVPCRWDRIGVGSFLAAVIAQLNGRDRRHRRGRGRVRPSDTHFHTKGFRADERGEKMDGEKKRDAAE